MAEALPKEIRSRVFAARDAGEGTRAVAKRFGVSEAWVRRLMQRRRESGEVAPRPSGGKRFEKIDRSRLANLVQETPDATLAELRDRLGVKCSLSGMHKALRGLKITFKKR